MTQEILDFFNELKRLFVFASMLVQYDITCCIMLECDASGFAIGTILSRLVSETGQWHSIAFWSHKMGPVEKNYGVREAEMLIIVEVCKH